jgi:predicted ribonuclease YlaK
LHGLTKDMPVKKDNNQKIFVLDTSVILYDHNAIRSFEEHDVAIPIHVLEELDNFKKGMIQLILKPANLSEPSTTFQKLI